MLLLCVHLHQGAYAPYNAQATLHMYPALWSLLLPVTVHGRVSDIWRGYAAQRLMDMLGLRLLFSPALVRQDRNVHNYLADFDSEGDLYLRAMRLLEQLRDWSPSDDALKAPHPLAACMEELWVMMYEHGYFQVRPEPYLGLYLGLYLPLSRPYLWVLQGALLCGYTTHLHVNSTILMWSVIPLGPFPDWRREARASVVALACGGRIRVPCCYPWGRESAASGRCDRRRRAGSEQHGGGSGAFGVCARRHHHRGSCSRCPSKRHWSGEQHKEAVK